MDEHISTKLFRRELFDPSSRFTQYRALYSDSRLVKDLDIVNELDGHSGCVNALSWSKTGHLLASGSDDQHLNIHRYQPEGSDAQFQLATTVATGHTQNIFSVKFMPHSSDRTVVTAAGDGEVRIFDLEYTGRAYQASRASQTATDERRRGRNHLYSGARYMSDGEANTRVYRSHGDRVKRIVTESSPNLFLTCSEDGEVRQWDLRQPSSAYPAPRGGRMSSTSGVPPPLISYRRYQIDLNTISCSTSQPHYIALGGSHLHAFLHDRRMIGRDRLDEAGMHLSPPAGRSFDDDEQMAQATKCVRKFAPHGKRKMFRADRGHITACKISDARPNEMIVSWSGDNIYSFDIMRSPDVIDVSSGGWSAKHHGQNRRSNVSSDKKRKRIQQESEPSHTHEDSGRRAAKQRPSQEAEDTTLRINYENGQSEDVHILEASTPAPHYLTEGQSSAASISRNVAKMHSVVLGRTEPQAQTAETLVSVIKMAKSTLEEVDTVMRGWGYPLDPLPDEVEHQNTLRAGRESTRRFVQAIGTLARALGGSSVKNPHATGFSEIQIRRNDLPLAQKEAFGYDFVRATLLWLDSGVGRLIEGFTRPADISASSRAGARLPIPPDQADLEAVDEYLIPYLLQYAGEEMIFDPQSNPFELDEHRQLFRSETEAVQSFAAAVRIPFADLSSTADGAREGELSQAQDRYEATQFWAGKVARGVLLNATADMESSLINQCFGGSNAFLDDSGVESSFPEASPDAFDVPQDDEDTESDGLDYDSDAFSENDSDDSSDPDELDGVPSLGLTRALASSARERRILRERAEPHVSCGTHTRIYSGHCNSQTVKDVNYFGINDEFVVSGSDDGNFFMWDAIGGHTGGGRHSSGRLVGIWEGDGEVVNVIQGHPYETMLAASGIDHTIKIFSSDAKARERARLGVGVHAHDASVFSSVAWPRRPGHRRGGRANGGEGNDLQSATSEPAMPASKSGPEDDEYIGQRGLSSRKRIHNASHIIERNDSERANRNQESYITLPQARLLQILFGSLGNVGAFASID